MLLIVGSYSFMAMPDGDSRHGMRLSDFRHAKPATRHER
jgi:hypothetical protein